MLRDISDYIPERTTPRRWIEIMKTDYAQTYYFEEYDDLLDLFDLRPIEMRARSVQLFENAVTNYTDSYIRTVMYNNLKANEKKYQEFASLFSSDIDIFSPVDLSETYTDTRRPNLSSSSTSSGQGSSSAKNNQTRTIENLPLTTRTSVHSVSPYDGTGSREESRDVTTDGGSSVTEESYTGNADTTNTTTSASSTVTTTGYETYEHTLRRTGRDGKFKISEIIDDAELSAAKLNFMDIILQDIADQLFLQVWL